MKDHCLLENRSFPNYSISNEYGKKYILEAMDYFNKWAEAYTLVNKEATSVASGPKKDQRGSYSFRNPIGTLL